MLKKSLDYTVCSIDPEHYNRINCNLTAPITRYSSLTVTSLTANADIVVLNEDDYITIDNKRYSLKTDYCNLNSETLASLLNNLFTLNELNINVRIDEARRFVFTSNKSFVINSMTYNYKLITGFYNTTFPINSDSFTLRYDKTPTFDNKYNTGVDKLNPELLALMKYSNDSL